MERTRGHQRRGVSSAKRNVRSNIPSPLPRTLVKRQAQPPNRGGSRAVPKTRQQSAPKTGRSFQPQLNETDDDAAETEPVASNVRRLTYVKPAPEVHQSATKLQGAQKTSRKSIPQKVGRRTGAAAFEGKNIRLLPDGTENFDDYWTDSEAEISSSRDSVPKEKNSTFNKPSNVVPMKLYQPPKKVAEAVRYSVAPKVGRRTGVAAFEGKKIRLLPDGTENFDDYFTDDSSSKDSYFTEPSHKKSSIQLEESSAVTDDDDSDKIMIHKSCDTRGLAVPTSPSNSKQLREHSAHEKTSEQHYKARSTSLLSPRRNLLASFVETDLKSSLNATQPDNDSGRCNKSGPCSVRPADTEPVPLRRSSLRKISQNTDSVSFRSSPLKNKSLSVPSRNKSNVAVDHESHVLYEGLEKSFTSRLKISQNKRTSLSSSNHQDASAEDSDSAQEGEAPFSNKSLKRSSRKKPRASEYTKSTSKIHEAIDKNHVIEENLIVNVNDGQHISSSTEAEKSSRHSLEKSANLSNTAKNKKIIVESINKTKSFKEPKNSLSIVSKSKNLTKAFSHSKIKTFASFRNRNVWIEDASSEEDSNITVSKSMSKRKVLDYAELSATDEADASHSVQPATKVKKLKKGHDNILQQSLSEYEAEISVDEVASVEANQKVPTVKKINDLSKRPRSRKSVYVGNHDKDSSLDEADAVVSTPKVRKSKTRDDVSTKRLTRGNRGSIQSQEFMVENNPNALPSNNDNTNASRIQNNKSKREKHRDVSSEHSINARSNAGNLSGEDETDDESQARKVRRSKRNKHDNVTSEGPRRNITTTVESSAGNLSDEAEACLVSKETMSKRNKSTNMSTEGASTKNIVEDDALVSADDGAPALFSPEDAVKAIQVPKATKLKTKKDGVSTVKQRPSINKIDEIDNVADASLPATKVKKSKKKKQMDTVPSSDGVRRGTRNRIPPLETWRGQRQVYKYKSGEGFVYTNISPGRKEDDGCRQALLRREQQRIELKRKEKKKGASRRIPKSVVFDAFREREVDVHLHRPFDFVEWTAITVAEGGKVPYYLSKTFASENVTFGFLEICPLEKKASQYSPEDNIHFLVVRGNLKVVIRKSEFMFERLDTFIVPCKEVYSIENIGKTKALLSFCTFKTPFFPYQIIDSGQQEKTQ